MANVQLLLARQSHWIFPVVIFQSLPTLPSHHYQYIISQVERLISKDGFPNYHNFLPNPCHGLFSTNGAIGCIQIGTMQQISLHVIHNSRMKQVCNIYLRSSILDATPPTTTNELIARNDSSFFKYCIARLIRSSICVKATS
jgi:hypothetical protein